MKIVRRKEYIKAMKENPCLENLAQTLKKHTSSEEEDDKPFLPSPKGVVLGEVPFHQPFGHCRYLLKSEKPSGLYFRATPEEIAAADAKGAFVYLELFSDRPDAMTMGRSLCPVVRINVLSPEEMMEVNYSGFFGVIYPYDDEALKFYGLQDLFAKNLTKVTDHSKETPASLMDALVTKRREAHIEWLEAALGAARTSGTKLRRLVSKIRDIGVPNDLYLQTVLRADKLASHILAETEGDE